MYKLWTSEEIADALDEGKKKQPYKVIAALLNRKYHDNQPIRNARKVKYITKRHRKNTTEHGVAPQRPKPKSPQTKLSAVPKVVAQIVEEELKDIGGSLPPELIKLLNNPPQEPPKARSSDDVNLTDADIEKHIQQTAAQQPFLQRATGIVRNPEIIIPETGWFAIVFYSDWHIGSIWTQLLTILYEAKIISATPAMYVFFGGDSADGGIPAGPHGGILNEAIMPPSMQRIVAGYITRLIAPKLKAAISGCHEWWSMDAADYDFIKQAAAHEGCVYLGGGNKYRITTAGGASWNGCYHHRAQGHSQYNVFHPCVRRALFHEQEADIICVAHNHLSGTTRQVLGERLRYMARTGARKNFDRYASKLANDENRDDLDVPVLLLHGTHGRKVKGQWIEGIPIAATVLSILRANDPYRKLF